MKNIIFILMSLSLISCKNMFINSAFKRIGIYDDENYFIHYANDSEEVILIPMQHLGTPLYYEDTKSIIDSLNSRGYFFYTEAIKIKNTPDSIMRKFRKIGGKSIATKGYKHLIDSVFGKNAKIKFKKEIVDQPKYHNWG